MKKAIFASLFLLSSIAQANCVVRLVDGSMSVKDQAQVQRILSEKGYSMAQEGQNADLALQTSVVMHACSNGVSALPCDTDLIDKGWREMEVVVRANMLNASGELQASGVGSSQRFLTGPSIRGATIKAVKNLETCQ